MPLDKPKNVPNDSLNTPYVTVNNNITALGSSTFTQLSGTLANRPSTASIGTSYYDTTTGQTEVYTVNGWVNPATAPNAPTNVTAANQAIAYGGTPAAYVYFTPATTGNPATTYTVNSNTGGFTATGTSSPIAITGLSAGTSYTFTVTATNAYGSATSSASSALVAGTISQPPTSLSASYGGGAVSVSFTAPSNTGASTVTSYTVYSSPGNLSATGSSSPIAVTGVSFGISYTFTAVANNSAGSSVLSAPSNSVTPVSGYTVEYLVVGGGGAGTYATAHSGGGGAGGFRNGTLLLGSATVTVGAGGPYSSTGKGSDSTLGVITSAGGGIGAQGSGPSYTPGALGDGGSGGGAHTGTSGWGYGNIPAVTPSQGNNGGTGVAPSPAYSSGGGGGAGTAGGNGYSTGGTGGGGATSSITGTSTYYAGGGGGGISNGYGGSGGSGGGGQGGNGYGLGTNQTAGGTNLGGGGGAAGTSGTAQPGGSGVVIIAYPTSLPTLGTIGAGLTYTYSTSSRSGYRVYTFTAGTGTIGF